VCELVVRVVCSVTLDGLLLVQLLEYWGPNEGPTPWEYNAAEAKRALALRIDFSQDAITALPL
jgi:hypothetical protein